MVFQRSMLNWRRGWGQSAMGLCACNCFGVVMLHRCIVNWRRGLITLPINHRYMLHHYTPSVSHIAQCTYTHGRCTPNPLINYRYMLHCYTPSVSHIGACTYTHDRLTPCQLTIDPCYTITPPLEINHRSMLHHYTP